MTNIQDMDFEHLCDRSKINTRLIKLLDLGPSVVLFLLLVCLLNIFIQEKDKTACNSPQSLLYIPEKTMK